MPTPGYMGTFRDKSASLLEMNHSGLLAESVREKKGQSFVPVSSFSFAASN